GITLRTPPDQTGLADVPFFRWPWRLWRKKFKQLGYTLWPVAAERRGETWRVVARILIVYVIAPAIASLVLFAVILWRRGDPIASWAGLAYALGWILISRLFTSWSGMSMVMPRAWLLL